jgi:hypothetical protein
MKLRNLAGNIELRFAFLCIVSPRHNTSLSLFDLPEDSDVDLIKIALPAEKKQETLGHQSKSSRTVREVALGSKPMT